MLKNMVHVDATTKMAIHGQNTIVLPEWLYVNASMAQMLVYASTATMQPTIMASGDGIHRPRWADSSP